MESTVHIGIMALSGVGTAVIVSLIVGFSTKFLSARIKDLKEDAMTKEMCNDRHNHIQSSLEKGGDKFNRFDTKIDKLQEGTGELTGKIDLLLQRNGVHKP